MTAPKVVRDGKVAVIVSPGYGAGWSTWADEGPNAKSAVFAPDVVAWIEDGKPEDDERYDAFEARYGYGGGLHQAEVEWLPVGTRFFIEEYHGHESLVVIDPDYGYVA